MGEIRSVKIDFDKNIIEINGMPYNKPTIVALPSEEDGWSIYKYFAPNSIVVPREECDRLNLTIESAVNNTL